MGAQCPVSKASHFYGRSCSNMLNQGVDRLLTLERMGPSVPVEHTSSEGGSTAEMKKGSTAEAGPSADRLTELTKLAPSLPVQHRLQGGLTQQRRPSHLQARTEGARAP